MSEENTFRYYQLEGEGLELLREYREGLASLIDARGRLEIEYTERINKLNASRQAKLRDQWYRMSAMVGLDPKKTWGSQEYQIETRYLADGFGAILYMPRANNPFFQEVPGEPETERQDPETDIPDDETTRH